MSILGKRPCGKAAGEFPEGRHRWVSEEELRKLLRLVGRLALAQVGGRALVILPDGSMFEQEVRDA